MIIRRLFAAVLVVVACAALGVAQEKPAPAKPPEATISTEKPPVLTEIQKLTIQNLIQRIEIAQLRAQAATEAFERAREEITMLMQSLQVPGYNLSLERLEYTKKAEPKKEPVK